MDENEFILHSTSLKNFKKIILDKKIKTNVEKKYKTFLIDENTKQIFTQFIFRDMEKEKHQIPCWGEVLFVLDKKILTDYAFYCTRIGGYFDNFKDAFLEKNRKNIFMKSNVNTTPLYNKLKKRINENIVIQNSRIMMKKSKVLSKTKVLSFLHSHEILFNKNIPLKKYCRCIIVDSKYIRLPKNELLKKIPIKYFDKYGINNLIDTIKL
jgi:hypothetical protein